MHEVDAEAEKAIVSLNGIVPLNGIHQTVGRSHPDLLFVRSRLADRTLSIGYRWKGSMEENFVFGGGGGGEEEAGEKLI